MSKFNPKKYLEGQITQEDCGHEILSTSGFNEGVYGRNYKCLICDKTLHYKYYECPSQDAYVYIDYSWMTSGGEELIKSMLSFFANRCIDEETIDIATLFKEISPDIEEITSFLKYQSIKKKVYN